MNNLCKELRSTIAAAILFVAWAATASAGIDGITGPAFTLTAKVDYVSTADGGSLFIWGYANGTARAQYPGPTLIVNQGATVTVTLSSAIPGQNVSIVFPGQEGVTAVTNAQGGKICRNIGPLACEALPGGASVTYTFTATRPGTFMYHSGTNPELQVEMGLFGALIVRPSMGANYAYNNAATRFDREYLFLLSEMDPRIHQVVASQGVAALANTDYVSNYFPNYWFLNGRTAPDTMDDPGILMYPTQPYNSLPQMHPGERLLIRLIGAGRESHPFHTHGNHTRIIARDGFMLESAPGTGPDLSQEVFTINSVPGQTVDGIFEWTGKNLGWDIYGLATPHNCNAGPDGLDTVTKEYCADHGKPFPVMLPETQFLTVGGFYSGSPFMGALGALPPGEGGLNPYGGFPFMWHSHSEKELTNYNIFPGGMLTMLIIQPHGAPIP